MGRRIGIRQGIIIGIMGIIGIIGIIRIIGIIGIIRIIGIIGIIRKCPPHGPCARALNSSESIQR